MRVTTEDMPPHISRLERDRAHFPVAWFASWRGKDPDYHRWRDRAVLTALEHHLCWICGEHRGGWGSFVIGPIGAINRTAAQPPAHQDCAVYAARYCPVLAEPGHDQPRVVAVWTTRTWRPVRDEVGQLSLFDLGYAGGCLWFAGGRPAGRATAMQALLAGLAEMKALSSDQTVWNELGRAGAAVTALLPRD